MEYSLKMNWASTYQCNSSISNFSNYMDLEEKNLLFDTLERYTALKRLKLNLIETEIEDGILARLSNMLSKCSFLEELTLRISGNFISLEGFENLLKKLEKLPNLRKLVLRARRIKSLQSKRPRVDSLIAELRVAVKDVMF